jgi:transposase
VLTEAMNGFRGMLGTRVIQCRPRDPEAKGLVERANQYLETSFLPGRGFSGPADSNAQLSGWLDRANTRQHRALGCRPADRWDADKAAMPGLPPVAPVTGWRLSTRLPRDYYVRVDSNDYSVDPSLIGRGRGGRWAGGGDGDLPGTPGRPAPEVLGRSPEHHRSRSRGCGGAAAPGPPPGQRPAG